MSNKQKKEERLFWNYVKRVSVKVDGWPEYRQITLGTPFTTHIEGMIVCKKTEDYVE